MRMSDWSSDVCSSDLAAYHLIAGSVHMEAYVYDHVRTPRGKGRPDGALHEITSVEMARQLLEAVRDRNQLDTSLLDDVIIGMAQPVGEQGGVLARRSAERRGGKGCVRPCRSRWSP